MAGSRIEYRTNALREYAAASDPWVRDGIPSARFDTARQVLRK